MTDEAFSEVLTLFETVYGMTLTLDQQRVWRALLAPLSDRRLREAAVEICRTSVYPPRPADLWTRITAMDGKAVPDADMTRERIESMKRGAVPMPKAVRAMLGWIGKKMPT